MTDICNGRKRNVTHTWDNDVVGDWVQGVHVTRCGPPDLRGRSTVERASEAMDSGPGAHLPWIKTRAASERDDRRMKTPRSDG